ncbi:MAG: MFS transporter [Candidatus Latescibacterota bacterium]
MSDNEPATDGYWALVRYNANFRHLWFGQIISLLGDWFNLIASASLVAELTNSGLAVGSLFVARMLAPVLVSPIAGVVADRYDRKRVLIATDIGRFFTAAAFLLVREPDQVWLLYALSFIQLGIGGFFFPARSAILPDIVPEHQVGAANALTSATWSVMLALGAALGGLVSGSWGIYPAFAIDAATFLVSALVLSRIRLAVKPALEGDKTLGAVLQQYLEGLRYFKHHIEVAVTATHKAALVLCFGAPLEVVSVSIALEVFTLGEGGALGLGLIYAVAGLGTGLGPIVGRYFVGDHLPSLRWSIALGYGLAIIGLLIVSTMHSLTVVLVGVFVRACGSGLLWVFSTQILLQTVAPQVRGRIFSTEIALSMLMSAVGASMGGYYLEWLDIAGAVQWMAALTVVPGLLWVGWLLAGPNRD